MTRRCRWFYANRDQLVQVFLNLIKNAAESDRRERHTTAKFS